MVEPNCDSKFGLQIPMPDEKICNERDDNLLIYNEAGLNERRLKRASPFCFEHYVSSNAARDEEGVHGLELHAYRFTLEAFYASGPLNWDKEALLTNLRINLHISNDEHLEGLRNLISASSSVRSYADD